MRRRRFLSLAASFACVPQFSVAQAWRGRALGADFSVRIDGPRALVGQALSELPGLLAAVERTFSLFDPASELSRLNAIGHASRVSPMLRDVVAISDRVHDLTGGVFDPTVQPLWRALASGGDAVAARRAIGWGRVRHGDGITLDSGQALTFNGVAQGYATDLFAQRLTTLGATRALIDLGEQVALGGAFRLGLADPDQGIVGWRSLTDAAVATSSPAAMALGQGQTHILSPDGSDPVWSTVSVEAPTATLADALSTAAVFMDRATLRRLRVVAGLGRIMTVDRAGRVYRI
ncbi:FAD:protein FMN transferase [Puniceibacterium sp. IMCC21224]|uniref:FAD:protein FMN transferase n=1 Tax=Puniceibacterium sp. IMCC21224 TaxID=1618204 RepID=UPI00064DCDEA|nr:FAD:protein FMN transferase [Puniceibacterium sp. IMCC21224]KMK66985.1 membrane-associated lipoprotein involved in thiamine biosynthesis [Puniceibacterium sp. IMCC21224]